MHCNHIHELKTWPAYFEMVESGIKAFDLRKDDRSYAIGDLLILWKYVPEEDRWSNPDDIVLDYFAGIGSVPWQALKMGRRGVGIELKRSYHELAHRFLDDLELQQAQPNFFDLVEQEAGSGATKASEQW